HYVDVDAVRPGDIDLAHEFPEPGEVGGQDGRRDHGRLPSTGLAPCATTTGPSGAKTNTCFRPGGAVFRSTGRKPCALLRRESYSPPPEGDTGTRFANRYHGVDFPVHPRARECPTASRTGSPPNSASRTGCGCGSSTCRSATRSSIPSRTSASPSTRST